MQRAHTALLLATMFSYHRPTDDTAPRYAAIGEAEQRTHGKIKALLAESRDALVQLDRLPALVVGTDKAAMEQAVLARIAARSNETFLAFATVINEQVPEGIVSAADALKAVAIQHVLRAASVVSEHIFKKNGVYVPFTEVPEQLAYARLAANKAVAVAGAMTVTVVTLDTPYDGFLGALDGSPQRVDFLNEGTVIARLCRNVGPENSWRLDGAPLRRDVTDVWGLYYIQCEKLRAAGYAIVGTPEPKPSQAVATPR